MWETVQKHSSGFAEGHSIGMTHGINSSASSRSCGVLSFIDKFEGIKHPLRVKIDSKQLTAFYA